MPGRVEIDVRHRGEEAFEHRAIDLRVADAELGRSMGVHRHALGGVDQQVLQGGGLRVLAADADLVAAGALGGLFALVTKHDDEILFRRTEFIPLQICWTERSYGFVNHYLIIPLYRTAAIDSDQDLERFFRE